VNELEPRFDFEEVFGPHYLRFYESVLTPEKSDQDAELVWRLLHMGPGMRVLDLACGHGRISNRLAARGAVVTGLDANAKFLERARADAVAFGVEVDYLLGDMRSLPWTDTFDRIVCWFTSFGYFGDEENRRVLSEANRVLHPDGRLLIDVNNRDRMIQGLRSEFVTEVDGAFMIDRHSLDVAANLLHTERVVVADGRTDRFHYSVRLFTFTELRDWLIQAGFRQVEAFGADGEPFSLESRRMIVVATR
jgi:SAM-dependent methyltransferase